MAQIDAFTASIENPGVCFFTLLVITALQLYIVKIQPFLLHFFNFNRRLIFLVS